MEIRWAVQGERWMFSTGIGEPHEAEVLYCAYARDDNKDSYPHTGHFHGTADQFLCTGWPPKVSVKRGGIKYGQSHP